MDCCLNGFVGCKVYRCSGFIYDLWYMKLVCYYKLIVVLFIIRLDFFNRVFVIVINCCCFCEKLFLLVDIFVVRVMVVLVLVELKVELKVDDVDDCVVDFLVMIVLR